MHRAAEGRSPPWLVAAVSGRMLAASAARGGHRVVVLDCFADRDTMGAAESVSAVASAGAPRLHRRALLAATRELEPAGGWAGIVYGSGFENRPGLLARLSAGRRLAGNPPEVVALMKDPARFFPLLARIGVRHPEVSLLPPRQPAGWLVKQGGGAGGTHVRPATGQGPRRGRYFQRLEPGRTLSVLFLADGARGFRLGINEQWTANHPALPFLYSGAVGDVLLPEAVLAGIDQLLNRLVAATGIVGLNGLDFLLEGTEPSILELNPRPTATLELHDPDWDTGLFDRHLRACRGELPAARPPAASARAATIVLSPVEAMLDPAFEFPGWCRDIPAVGTRFAPGDPFCTVHAEGPSPDEARRRVLERQRAMELELATLAAPPVSP